MPQDTLMQKKRQFLYLRNDILEEGIQMTDKVHKSKSTKILENRGS